MGRLTELADTSAWTNRAKQGTVRADFDARLAAGAIATCEIVKLELLWSSRDHADFRRLREDLEALPAIAVDAQVWQRATDVFERLVARDPLHHRQVPLPDLLVAASAEVAGVTVCHYDAHFDVIAGVTGQPVRAIAPLGSL